MFELAMQIFAMIIGLASGMIISGAVFAFITAIGIVPRLAQKTKTRAYCRIYESALVIGGILGTAAGFWQIRLPFGAIVAAILSLCIGIFYGAIAMSIAETLDVIPILTRRGRVQQGLFYFVLAIALGKMTGALLYFLVPGFFDPSHM
ncbi:MAG: stage V sporulation protein AB [Clostridiales bacterium]|jgi:stage V sporulation protein AB|nr:stage V sporulation protein AB [Clostridiales bacterium]